MKTDDRLGSLTLTLGAALLCLVLVAYVPAMAAGWVWDDDSHITDNTTLRTPRGLGRIWLEVGATPQYYPLVFTSFWVEYHLWELNATGYHVTNVVLHGLNAWLVWLILRWLRVPGAWLAAALFALHPVHVESVAWVTERKNVLSGLFFLSAVLAWLRFDATRSHGWYGVALIAFLGALLSKTVTCTLPAVLALLLWWQHGRVTRRDWLALAPMFAAGLGMGMLTVWLERTQVGAVGEAWSLSTLHRFLIAGRALWFYAVKLLWPSPLMFIYPRWKVDPSAGWWYAFPLAALAVAAGLWLARHRVGKGPLVAVLVFAGTLFPALGFFDVYPFRYSFVADHFQYLASVPLIALFAAVLCIALRRRTVVVGVSAIILLPLLLLTWRQGFVYYSARTLWEDTLSKNPECSVAHANLGLLSAEKGGYASAAKHFGEVVRLNPDSLGDRLKFATLCALAGWEDDAVAAFHAALEMRPESIEAHAGLAEILRRQGNRDEAARHLTEALRLDPHDAELHNSLGIVRAEQGQWDAAVELFTAALRLAPSSAMYRRNVDTAKQSRRKSPGP